MCSSTGWPVYRSLGRKRAWRRMTCPAKWQQETMKRFFDFTMKSAPSKSGWRPSRVAWRGWWFALITGIALLATSCRTTSGSTTIQRADSLRWQRKVSVALEAIPARTLAFRLPLPELRNLPEGERMERTGSGFAVSVGLRGDSLDIRALAEPLPALTYTEEESIDRIRDASAEQAERQEAAAASVLTRFKPVLNAVILILILVIILLIVIQIWQKQRKQGQSV